jgi:phosphatidylglycerol---prolipoprotein diacylglyceryl transferase
MTSLGPVKIYLLVYALSLVAHGLLAQRWCSKLALGRWIGLGLSACYVLGMGVGARVLYDIANGQFHPANYLRPGYYFTDGLWGGPLAYLMLAAAMAWAYAARVQAKCIKLNPTNSAGPALDVMVLSLPIPMAIAKLACLFNGCCFGTPCNWPWCVTYPCHVEPPAGIARHPTQIYEIVGLLFIYIVLVTLERRRWHGLLALWFMFLYGLARPVTEFFRMPGEGLRLAGIFSASQAICLAGASAALLALLFLRPPRRAFERPTIQLAFG